jgi:hypothetical protein
MGSTGSTWFAKLLDSHPEVHCTHEGLIQQVYPNTRYTPDDVLRFIEYFAWDAKHSAYLAVGDIGSAFFTHLPYLTSFTTGILMRHPAKILHTRLCTYATDQSFTEIAPETAVAVSELWGIDLNCYDSMDRIFLNDIFVFATQLGAVGKTDLTIRIEDLNRLSYCHETLKRLTNLDYDEGLITSALRLRTNQRSGPAIPVKDIVERFSPRQRDWYSSMLADVAPCFGYSLFED